MRPVWQTAAHWGSGDRRNAADALLRPTSGRVNDDGRWRNGANGGAYPRWGWNVAQFARRCLRWDMDGAIRPACGSDRRLEGERDGSRSRRPAATVSGRAPAMGAEPATAQRLKAKPRKRDAKACSGTQIAARGCRKATPRDREVPEDPQGSRGGLTASWSRKAPRLPMRHPRTRRTSAAIAGGAEVYACNHGPHDQ